MQYLKTVLAGIIGLAAAMAGHSARANIIDVGYSVTTISFATLFSTTDPLVIIQQDKRWSDFTASANFASLSGGQFSLVSPQPGEDLHTFVAQGPIGLGVGTYTLSYTISVVQPSPVQIIRSSTGLDFNSGTGTLNETFSTGQSLTTSGATVSTDLPHVIQEHVTDTLVVTSSASFISLSNSFLQSNVPIPEPATVAILGLGMLAIGWTRYRS